MSAEGGAGESSSYAREGTFAHAVAAYILETDDIPKADSEFQFLDHDREIVDIVTEEMLEHVMVYVNHVREHGKTGAVWVEHHVDLSPMVRDEMWGTSDAIISKARELVVSDFKYGYYPVHIIDMDLLLDTACGELGHVNAQLLYYAAGAAHQHEWKHPVIILEIVQPRCMEVPTIQSTTVTREALRHWVDNDLYRAAHAATSENAPLSAGDWCRFCPALSICPEARRAVQELAASDFAEMTVQPPDVPETVEKLTAVLHWAPIIEAWLRACEVSAFQLMQRGIKIPGFKLVEKRANRGWPKGHSNREIFDLLKAAGATGKFEHFVTEEFLTPAKSEKIAGKKPVNAVCTHPHGELTIAPESSRKAAIELEEPESDFEEFAK